MRILVVDDEPLNRFLLMHMLEENGYMNCHEAESGEQAIEMAEKDPPDIVLLDVMMPNMSGFEVAPILKELQQEIYLPVIFITSLDDDDSLAKGLNVGGDDFVSKPFNKVVLAAKLKAHSRTRLLSKKAQKQNTELLYHQRYIEREHAIVEHIFSNVLTMNPANSRFFDFHISPASNFNGDVLLFERSPNGGLIALLGDFTGHGLASAIGAIPVTRTFQTMVEKGIPVGEMAATINKTLLDFLPDGMFFACAIIEIAENGKLLEIWNGGLPHMILVDSEGKIKKRVNSLHMALGVLEADEFEDDVHRFEMSYGDRIMGYTDGVTELTNASDVMLGEEGLENWITGTNSISTQQIMENIEEFSAAEEQADDITMFFYEAKELGLKRKVAEVPKIPFNVQIQLQGAELATSNPVAEVLDLLGGHNAFHGVRSNIFTVMSELYTNSLDHGVLKLDSSIKNSPDGFLEYFQERENRLAEIKEGNINLCVSYSPTPAALIFSIKDSGEGFDSDKIYSQADSDETYGRGMVLVKELTDHVLYEERGTKVTAVFLLDNSDENVQQFDLSQFCACC